MSNENKADETIRIYKKVITYYKPRIKHDFDYEGLFPYLVFFDEIPSNKKEFYIDGFIRIVWGYLDSKKGIPKKSISSLKASILKYQKSMRVMYCTTYVSDEVIDRNGDIYSYDGYDDFSDGFDITLHFENAPKEIQDNYLINIKLLKEIDLFNDYVLAMRSTKGSIKDIPVEVLRREFKLLDPLQFYQEFRPNKEHLKNYLNDIKITYNLRNVLTLKELVDSI